METKTPEKNGSNRFIFVIVLIVALLAIFILYFIKSGSKTVSEEPPIPPDIYATSTASTTQALHNSQLPTSTTNTGANDMNGSGQNEPSQPVQNTGYQSPISIPLSQGHIVGGTRVADQVLIYPWAVLEDSRCPSDVDCVWAGKIRVALRLLNPNTKAELVTAGNVLEVGQSVKVNGLEITLLEVQPDNMSNVKIKDSEYRFVLGIKRI